MLDKTILLWNGPEIWDFENIDILERMHLPFLESHITFLRSCPDELPHANKPNNRRVLRLWRNNKSANGVDKILQAAFSLGDHEFLMTFNKVL